MIELWLGLAALVLLVVFLLLWPALRGAGAQRKMNAGVEEKRAALAALYREQRSELEAARASGAMDDAQFTQLEAEMARNLLQAEQSVNGESRQGGRGLLLALAVVLPVVALAIYFQSGHVGELELYRDIVASQQGKSNRATEARITSQLLERTRANPEDLTTRYVLAQRLMVGGDLDGAVESYRYIVEREPQAAGVKAELAQALFFQQGSRVTDEVRRLVGEVLEAQPDNGTALGLAGIAAFEEENFRVARALWQRALNQLAPGSAAAEALAAGVARAEKALVERGETLESATVANTPVSSEDPASSEPAIRVSVSLADGVEAADDTPVFIYARGAESPMPLAIVRLSAGDLPAEVVLDESRAMMPGRSLASVQAVQLVARLAVNGDARPAPGDWQGSIESLPESDWSRPVAITIDRQL
ncbi:c-type cytochrome biogenesis protein CcmI [Microbulbifer yueqingensis]|uniref:Cytochrome c-type biogenesis protein CcmH n=1 Tax=Microbulbifer yueqingensis TaxID=658219 RepID=A0A1G9AKL1_9GAMM|nr:c-type cytochrome biogenesis protein CcmI [Microbulbifer yueqingensis]SDK27828.1 cytochrome c-type biogenesis protein CcmH [Microbulbifer yueqingensis]